MDQEIIDKLLSQERIIPSTSPRYEEVATRLYPLRLHNLEAGIFYRASPAYYEDIFIKLEAFIKTTITREGEIFLEYLTKSLQYELPDKTSHITFYEREKDRLFLKMATYAEFGLTEDTWKYAKDCMYGHISRNFSEWVEYWDSVSEIEFQYFPGADAESFNRALKLITLLNCFDELYVLAYNNGYDFRTAIKERSSNPEDEDTEEEETNEVNHIYPQKLVWLGTPAHLALIIDLLIDKEYLKKPSPFGERNAEILLSMFEFKFFSPTKASLGRLLHKDSYPIVDITSVDQFYRIPNRNELKK